MKKHYFRAKALKVGSEIHSKRNFTSQLEILYHTYTHATHMHMYNKTNFHEIPLQHTMLTDIYYFVLFHFISLF